MLWGKVLYLIAIAARSEPKDQSRLSPVPPSLPPRNRLETLHPGNICQSVRLNDEWVWRCLAKAKGVNGE